MAVTYKEAGVDVEAGYSAVELMKKHVKKTYNKSVVTDIGSFGGVYALDDNTFLVAGCDGVGTKLKAAFIMDKHDTVGVDCVAMCVNDVVCLGAKPLFFLDYIATGKMVPAVIEKIVAGVANGCVAAGCALIGGETAEMPGFYKVGEYDIAGFCVGIVKKDELINGKNVKAGDAVIGLASSGIHSNGFSFIRSFIDMNSIQLHSAPYPLNKTMGEEFLTPTKIYVNSILKIKEEFSLNAVSNITGGGFYENIPRMFSNGLGAKIKLDSWEIPSIFKFILNESGMDQKEAFSTFNMGIGMVISVPNDQVKDVIKRLGKLGETAYLIGEVVSKSGVEIVK